MIKAFICSIKRNNKGSLVGDWVFFPTTTEEIKEGLLSVGIKVEEEELFVDKYDFGKFSELASSFGQFSELSSHFGEFSNLASYFGKHPNLSELNYFAAKLEALSDDELTLFEGICEFEGIIEPEVDTICDAINVMDSLDAYTLYPAIKDLSALGFYYVVESGMYDLDALGRLVDYIDYETYGLDRKNDVIGEITSKGFILLDGDVETGYKDANDVPEEYRIVF